jgi:RNA polymerase sigma factor (sigma-70 family)
MPRRMSELELVGLSKSFLARPGGTMTPEERLAFAESHSIHEDVIRAVIRRFHYPPEVVDDLTQDVWAKVFAGLERLRPYPALGSVTGWVVKIANNEAKSHARQQAKRREEPLTPATADALADPEPDPDIEFELMQNEADLRELIEGFAASLKLEHDQRAVRLRWLQECSLSRIMEDMDISEDCAWGILRRVRPELADYLHRKGYGAPREESAKLFRFSNR